MQFDQYQSAADLWILSVLGEKVRDDKMERAYRLIEEALELAQACGASKADVLALADYVFARPAGEIEQEVGGLLITLACLANPNGISLTKAAYRSLGEAYAKADRIRAKVATKPKGSPLPGVAPDERKPNG